MTTRAENRKIAAPTQLQGAWNAWLGGMAECFRSTPWPFPVGASPGLGLVRNVQPATPARRKKGQAASPVTDGGKATARRETMTKTATASKAAPSKMAAPKPAPKKAPPAKAFGKKGR